jgi:hypothetical protein
MVAAFFQDGPAKMDRPDPPEPIVKGVIGNASMARAIFFSGRKGKRGKERPA